MLLSVAIINKQTFLTKLTRKYKLIKQSRTIQISCSLLKSTNGQFNQKYPTYCVLSFLGRSAVTSYDNIRIALDSRGRLTGKNGPPQGRTTTGKGRAQTK